MPLTVRKAILGHESTMSGYCQVFAAIERTLIRDQAPTAEAVSGHILLNDEFDYTDAKLFFKAGGMPQHALQYLLSTLKRISLVHRSAATLEVQLSHLPRCLNDTSYDMVTNKLLDVPRSGVMNAYTHIFEIK